MIKLPASNDCLSWQGADKTFLLPFRLAVAVSLFSYSTRIKSSPDSLSIRTLSFGKKTAMPLISQARSSVDGASWEEQTLLGRNRSGSSSSFESLRSPVTPLDAYPFPTVQDLEKAGPIHLGPAYPKSATRSWRQFLLHIRPKVVSILALYVLCASLAILLLLPRHHYGTRSMLHSRAKSSSPLYRDLPVTLGVVPKRIASHNDCMFKPPNVSISG